LYLSLRTTGKGIEREVKDSRGVLSNRRLIEDRPKIVDLKQRFGDLRIIMVRIRCHCEHKRRATGILRMKKKKAKESDLVRQAN
jgi:IS30 family transposase